MTWMQNNENMKRLFAGSFCGMPVSENDEMAELLQGLDGNNPVYFDNQGTIYMDRDSASTSGSNLMELKGGEFAGDLNDEEDELERRRQLLSEGEDILLTPNRTIAEDKNTIDSNGGNLHKLQKGDFWSPSSANSNQWYVKRPDLLKAEIELMYRFYPDARYTKLRNGDIVWSIKMKISRTGFCEPWTFFLRYEPNHPNNNSFGGSVHVLLVNPDYNTLCARARAAGRPGIPHTLPSEELGENGKKYIKLCTRRTQDVQTGETATSSAVQAAGWAADWALHFELGLRNKKVWNDWCNDAHFRHLMI